MSILDSESSEDDSLPHDEENANAFLVQGQEHITLTPARIQHTHERTRTPNSDSNTPIVDNELPPLTSHQLSARQIIDKKLPEFNGNPAEWPLFLSTFKQTTKMCGLTNDENLIRLRQALKDKAKERVVSQLSIPSLVPQIIKTLQMIYGRPEQILHLQINKIKNEPALKSDKLESLIDFSVMVNNLCATMEASDLFNHLNSPMLLQELVDKLPPNLKLDWAAFRVRTPTINLISFQEWLSEIAERACPVMSTC
uniref:CSON006693 protein n=1 Tax=Culicoides sonorensis TaxID=179676 RepID=A0A336KBZ7_CULSO